VAACVFTFIKWVGSIWPKLFIKPIGRALFFCFTVPETPNQQLLALQNTVPQILFGHLYYGLLHLHQFFKITYQERQRDMAQ